MPLALWDADVERAEGDAGIGARCSFEVRERGQGGKEQRDVVVVVLDDHVGKPIDKQEPPMREGLLLLSEIAMASRQSLRKAVPSVPPAALSLSRLEGGFHHH